MPKSFIIRMDDDEPWETEDVRDAIENLFPNANFTVRTFGRRKRR